MMGVEMEQMYMVYGKSLEWYTELEEERNSMTFVLSTLEQIFTDVWEPQKLNANVENALVDRFHLSIPVLRLSEEKLTFSF